MAKGDTNHICNTLDPDVLTVMCGVKSAAEEYTCYLSCSSREPSGVSAALYAGEQTLNGQRSWGSGERELALPLNHLTFKWSDDKETGPESWTPLGTFLTKHEVRIPHLHCFPPRRL
ncbi:hypothetical protein NQZ68_004222 [Dissostichus eleginoides]|nr:hypothetical protein NQZ68_004222 [Dissostichus eleginoides]